MMKATPLSAQPWSSSTFGWTGIDYRVEMGQAVYCPQPVAREDFTTAHGFANEMRRLEIVPMFTIGCASAEDAVPIRNALAGQSIQEARVLDGACADWTPFRTTMGRYALYIEHADLVVSGETPFALALRDDPKLLLRLAIVLLRYQPSMLWLEYRGYPIGAVVDRALFLGRYAIPRRAGELVLYDTRQFAAALGLIGGYDLSWPLIPPTDSEVNIDERHAQGYWNAPLSCPPGPGERRFVEVCLNAYPSFLPSPGKPGGLWTCLANDWYDHRRILREYVGMRADLQIHGKIQHGWQSGCGVDGERGYKPESMTFRFPLFLWNVRNRDAADRDGLQNVQMIGAPFLYGDFGPDPGPADAKALLVFPYHSVPEYPLANDWSRYAEAVWASARERGFEKATVCLHHHDMEDVAPREALRACGLEVTTAGHALEPRFLDRVAWLIRCHAAVTSDRICTAGLYAEVLGRPFFLSGGALKSDPPDPDEGMGADREWIAREMPEFLEFTGEGHRDVALRELGAEFKRTPEDLRDTLYGWLLP